MTTTCSRCTISETKVNLALQKIAISWGLIPHTRLVLMFNFMPNMQSVIFKCVVIKSCSHVLRPIFVGFLASVKATATVHAEGI